MDRMCIWPPQPLNTCRDVGRILLLYLLRWPMHFWLIFQNLWWQSMIDQQNHSNTLCPRPVWTWIFACLCINSLGIAYLLFKFVVMRTRNRMRFVVCKMKISKVQSSASLSGSLRTFTEKSLLMMENTDANWCLESNCFSYPFGSRYIYT